MWKVRADIGTDREDRRASIRAPVSDELYERLYGLGGLARAPFDYFSYGRKFFTHMTISFLGPFGILLLLGLRLETVASLRFHRFLTFKDNPLLVFIFLQPVAIAGLIWLYWHGFASLVWLNYLIVACTLRNALVSVKYGFFAPTLQQDIRQDTREATGMDPAAIYALAQWVDAPFSLLGVELRVACKSCSLLKGECLGELGLRFKQVPTWMAEYMRDTAAAETSQLTRSAKAAVMIKDIQSSFLDPNHTSLTSRPSVDQSEFIIPLLRLAELLLLAEKGRYKMKYTCFGRMCCLPICGGDSIRILGLVFAIPPIIEICYLMSRSNAVTWIDLLVASCTCLIAFVLTETEFVVNIFYMQAAIVDLRRRCHLDCSLLALLGPRALSDLPANDSVRRCAQDTIFFGSLLDLTDVDTIHSLSQLRRIMRKVGVSWFRRFHIFLSIMLLSIVLLGADLFYNLLTNCDPLSGDYNEVRWHERLLKIVMLILFAGPLLRTVSKGIALGYRMNRVGEEYWPLVLESARINNRIATSSLWSPEASSGMLGSFRQKLCEADTALELMIRHVYALQVRSPVTVLGLRASRNLIRAIRTISLSLLTFAAKGLFDASET